jgi:hypothetical protein
MIKALRTKDDPAWAARKKAAQEHTKTRLSLKGKKFKELTADEKDRLLEMIAVELGILARDDDSK